MAQSFSVAVLGNQGGVDSLLYFEYGLQVFDLSVDQICKLIENPDISKVAELGAHPRVQYSVMTGGRSFPLVSREEVAQTVQGVEIVIVLMSTRPYYMTSLSQEFFNVVFMENLAENCHHVVLRITKDSDPGMLKNGRDGLGRKHRVSRRLGGKVDTDKVLKMYGFVKEKIKAKVSLIADEGNQKSKKDPVTVKINKLHSELKGYEFKVAVTQPVKETLSAGKSLLGLGHRFSSWLGSLVKSQ